MSTTNETHKKFYNADSADAVITEIHARLDEQDKMLNSLHGHLKGVEETLDKVHEQTLKTNGRVTSHDSAISTLNQSTETMATSFAEIRAWLKALCAVGTAITLVMGLIGWLLANDFIRINNPKNQPSMGVVQTLNSTKP